MKDPLTNLTYGSETPISTAQDASTTASTEDCWCDPIAKQIGMTAEEQLAFRMEGLQRRRTLGRWTGRLTRFRTSKPEKSRTNEDHVRDYRSADTYTGARS